VLIPAAIGVVLGLSIFALARWLAVESDRSFYPTILIVIASYYVLFAAIAGDSAGAAVELAIAVPFVACALLGLRTGTTVVAVGIIMHGGYDLMHSIFQFEHGAPNWWPAFCGAIDLVLGLALIVTQSRDRQQA
jgi:uncharacterized membrane protein HdeD (DUF308 family)